MREFSIYTGMKSAQGEQASKRYKKIEGKNKTWYVAIQGNSADNIYVDTHDPKSEGFAGSTLEFQLEDGTIDKVKGPWHSNSESLLSDTGYDITDKHLTQGIIALDSTNKETGPWGVTIHNDILHYDEIPVIGDFDRIPNMAQEFANKLNQPVYYAVITDGGGSSTWCKPVNK
jgi:hypothetical protein